MAKGKIKIGMLGMGTIGNGVAELLEKNGNKISERSGIDFELKAVLVRDTSKHRTSNMPGRLYTSDPSAVIDDREIQIVIELIGGIEPAREYISRALQQGKYVITANKDLMASHGEQLMTLARENNCDIYFEASVGGAIPIIRPLRHSLVADRIRRIIGIVNGTTNYILSKMASDRLSFGDALKEAQDLGFAEPDPSNDVDGLDAAYKLCIMSGLAFDRSIEVNKIFVEGIRNVTLEDVAYAGEIGYVIKLVAIGEQLKEGLALRVHPTLVPIAHPLASVSSEFNAIFIEGEAAGEVMFYGRGAGALPTASAVLADLAEALRSIRREARNGFLVQAKNRAEYLSLENLESRFYLRILADDRPGVFAALANAFGDEQVSLDMVIQKRKVNNTAEIVLITHTVCEAAFQRALERVLKLDAIKPNYGKYRLLS